MRKLLLYLILFVSFFTTNAAAQRLTVESFGPSGTSLLASTQPKYDRNGVACAVLHVKIAVQGVKFYDDFIWDTPTERVSEYTIYMVDGAKKIKVSAPGFLPLDVRFAEYDKENYMLRSKNDYELVIVIPPGVQAATAPQTAQAENAMSYFVLSVSPKNALVEIDGELRNLNADGTLMELLKAGEHRYRITAPGFHPEENSFVIGSERLRKSVELRSSMATLTLSCDTEGASLFVNELQKGTGRWSGQLVAGNYLVEARKEGYVSQQQTVTLAENDSKNIVFPQLKGRFGSLNVAYTPVDAEVWIDGKKVGLSPDIFHNILLGKHKVEIRKKGYTQQSKTVEIQEGKVLQITGELKSEPKNTTSSGSVGNHEYVDLGLPSGTLWATCNVGANKPEDYGDYFAWGETKPKSIYDWKAYKWCKGSSSTMTKYCTSSSDGKVDNKKELKATDDAAAVNWDSAWRMPTKEQIDELRNSSYTTTAWTTLNGVQGCKITSKKNGKSIFLPAAGRCDSGSLNNAGSYGYYWSRSLGSFYSYRAFYLIFNSGNVDWNYYDRYCGQSVRPVRSAAASE